MSNSVVKMALASTPCQMEEVRVQSVGDDECVLQTSAGAELGRRAVSCLVSPEPGDLVLVSRSLRAVYILSVLERQAAKDSEMTLDFKGPVRMCSTDDITISSRKAHWINQETSVSTGKLSVAAANVSAVSENMTLHGSALRVISHSLDVIGERMSRQVNTLVSLVRGNEVRQSHQLSEQVLNTRLQKSKQTVIDAKNDLRINAERIHMG